MKFVLITFAIFTLATTIQCQAQPTKAVQNALYIGKKELLSKQLIQVNNTVLRCKCWKFITSSKCN